MTMQPGTMSLAVFEKRYPSAARARAALRRSVVARMAGVPTPAARPGEASTSLLFDWVEAKAPPSLPQLIRAVGRLGRMATDGLNRFDPFLRIRPRLDLASSGIREMHAELVAQNATLDWPAETVIHGDFHPGQCLQDWSGKVWLVDLDDLALGPPEADLGNLAAWIATRARGNLDAQAKIAMDEVTAHAPKLDPALIGHFCRIALLRRALKLAGKGQHWALGQIASSI
jgi:Phosphotransferase enzyme family